MMGRLPVQKIRVLWSYIEIDRRLCRGALLLVLQPQFVFPWPRLRLVTPDLTPQNELP